MRLPCVACPWAEPQPAAYAKRCVDGCQLSGIHAPTKLSALSILFVLIQPALQFCDLLVPRRLGTFLVHQTHHVGLTEFGQIYTGCRRHRPCETGRGAVGLFEAGPHLLTQHLPHAGRAAALGW